MLCYFLLILCKAIQKSLHTRYLTCQVKRQVTFPLRILLPTNITSSISGNLYLSSKITVHFNQQCSTMLHVYSQCDFLQEQNVHHLKPSEMR